MKKMWNQFRELLWPLLERPDSPSATENPGIYDLNIEDENLELAYQLQLRILQEEEDRRKSTESKAAIFMGTLSLAATIVFATNTFLWGKGIAAPTVRVFVIVSFILAIYTLRTVWFSAKVIERTSFHVLDNEDINIIGDKRKYFRTMIMKLAKIAKANSIVVNSKMDNLILAQEYYKRAIVAICIYALLTLFYAFFA